MGIGRFGDTHWPAKVVSTHDDTNSIIYKRKNGQIGAYEGFTGYRLKTVAVEDAAGNELLIVLRFNDHVSP